MTVENKKPKPIRNKWLPYTFDLVPVKLAPFDLSPVSDIPIRLLVEQGIISRKRDLALYRLQEDWNGHPKNSIVISGPIEEGQPFAVWIGDNHYQKLEEEEEEPETVQSEEHVRPVPSVPSPMPISRQPGGRCFPLRAPKSLFAHRCAPDSGQKPEPDRTYSLFPKKVSAVRSSESKPTRRRGFLSL